jgi:hypothetical protein
MLYRHMNKKPILVLGALMMLIMLLNLFQSDMFKEYRDKLKTTSCRAVIVNLEKRIPASWDISCKENIITLVVPNETQVVEANLRPLLYREMANTLMFVAKESPEENLERTFSVIVRIVHPELTINSLITGANLVKLRNMQTPELIAEHLKSSVTVQEVSPNSEKKD